MIGRLVHLGIVLPSIHHFMSTLRELPRKPVNRRRMNLNTNVIEDLKLMLFSLEEAHIGVDMNLLVYRKPTKVYRSDSCPAGLGGYSIRFMPCRLGRIQHRWLCLDILHPFMVKVSSLDVIAKILVTGD